MGMYDEPHSEPTPKEVEPAHKVDKSSPASGPFLEDVYAERENRKRESRSKAHAALLKAAKKAKKEQEEEKDAGE